MPHPENMDNSLVPFPSALAAIWLRESQPTRPCLACSTSDHFLHDATKEASPIFELFHCLD
jgi:hypothetical protein